MRSSSTIYQRSLSGAINFNMFGKRGGRKFSTKISTWNVRTALSKEQQERIVLDLGKQDIDFCSLQELRLKEKGVITFSVYDEFNDKTYDYTLLYSGLKEGGHEGVGLIFKPSYLHYLIDWDSNCDLPGRIMWASFSGCSFVSVYGYTEARDTLEQKTNFFGNLDKTYSELKSQFELNTAIFVGEISTVESVYGVTQIC